MPEDVLVVRLTGDRLLMEALDPGTKYVGINLYVDDDYEEEPPLLKSARCIKQVRMRSSPSTASSDNILGYYYVGDAFEVLEERSIGSDIWVRTGFKQWGAMRYNGTDFMEYT